MRSCSSAQPRPTAKRQARDGLAVDAGEARDGALAEAFAQGGDDLNLLFAGKDVHGGLNPTRYGIVARRMENRSRKAAIFA